MSLCVKGTFHIQNAISSSFLRLDPTSPAFLSEPDVEIINGVLFRTHVVMARIRTNGFGRKMEFLKIKFQNRPHVDKKDLISTNLGNSSSGHNDDCCDIFNKKILRSNSS